MLTRSLTRPTLILLVICIAVKLGFVAVYAGSMRWVMDEFAQAYSSHFLDLGLYSKVDPIKPALPQLAFYGAAKLATASSAILQLWRAETAVAALLLVVATGLAARRLHGSWLATLFATFTLLSFSNFLEHSFRVRNDSFAVMLAVAALVALLRPGSPLWSTYGSGLLAGGAFLCTQKTIYQLLALLVAQGVLGWKQAGRSRALARAVRFGVGASLAVVLYAIGFGGLHAAEVVGSLLFSPVRWAGMVMSAQAFPDLRLYVTQSLLRNPVAYALCAAGLARCFATFAQQTPERVATALATIIVTIAVFSHPQPWPYLFVMCMPFLALFAPLCLDWLVEQYRPAAFLLASVVLSFSFKRNVHALSHDNAEQFRVVREAEAMLAPEDHYFDGVAMVPTRQITGNYPYWWWDSPMLLLIRQQLEQGRPQNFLSVLDQQPKLWILNYRLQRLADVLGPVLELGTVRVSDVIAVSGRTITPGESSIFQNFWPGRYRLLEGNGRVSSAELLLDGQPCAAPCLISAGEHHVATSANSLSFLLPADVVPPRQLPVRAPPFELFADVYDF